MNGERIRLALRALPDSLPLAQRLRLALKTLLRRDRLRCLKVEIDDGAAVTPIASDPTPENRA
ncbi:MAG: hypothetical protein HZB38_06160 [Planctomycetes bacterium]|nr:hypothetical protein [Planctomycetota bacterium]